MFIILSFDIFPGGVDKERMLQQHVLVIFTINQDQGCLLPFVTPSDHIHTKLTTVFIEIFSSLIKDTFIIFF